MESELLKLVSTKQYSDIHERMPTEIQNNRGWKAKKVLTFFSVF